MSAQGTKMFRLDGIAYKLFPPGLDTTWMEEANCIGEDTHVFFPAKGEPTRAAKAICAQCRVSDACLEYAHLTKERFGIWGGHSERERRRIRNRRAA